MENTQNPNSTTLTSDEKTWGWLVHLCNFFGLVGLIITAVTHGNHKDKSAFLKAQASNALNWQITLLICCVIGVIPFLGWLVLVAALVCNVIFSISAIMAANKGEIYKYPFSFKFVK